MSVHAQEDVRDTGQAKSSMWWDGDAIVAVDQRLLPHERVEMRLRTVDEVMDAIATLAVRGAPAIGLVGALGVVLAARGDSGEDFVRAEADRIAATRPTAVNLRWALDRVLTRLGDGPDGLLAEALDMIAEDRATNAALAAHTADLVETLVPRPDVRVYTHCNTGSFATAAIGTALGAIVELHERGRIGEVIAGETRPLLQGARLTAFELGAAGVPFRLCVDSAAAAAMSRGLVDVVLVGADRIAANGDTANKIGTYALAVAARHHGIPFVVVAPESTWDRSLATGTSIVIEDRAHHEVTGFAGQVTAPADTSAFNPAFDVTPAELITAIVTETGTVFPSADNEICAMAASLYERGWLPGTAGNISVRTGTETFDITASGRDKGALTSADIVPALVADASAAQPGDGAKPSAEASIHAAVYRSTGAGAVIHTHSPQATALATLLGGMAEGIAEFPLGSWELAKGLGPNGRISPLPVFPNWDDVPRIAADVDAYLTPESLPALLIARHGVTVWGRDLAEARNRLECVESIAQLILLTGGSG